MTLPTSSDITSFCETCGAYANPLLAACPQCGWQRPAHTILPAPGMPLWKTDLGAPVRANALPVGDLVLFAWGDRETPGGVTALEQANGSVRWRRKLPYLPESGLVLCAGKVLCTTIGFLNRGAELIALNAADGSFAWRQPLSAGGYTQPVALDKQLVYAAAVDGRICAFDFNSGKPIDGFQVQLPPGNTWLTLVDEELVVLCECGEIHLLAANTGKARLPQPISTGGRISSPPTLYKNRLFFGLADGRMAEYDVYHRKLDIIAAFERPVICAPGITRGALYVGSNDRHLRAFDLLQKNLQWEHPFRHSPTTSPMLQDGLVFCGVNDGCLHALDAASGEPIWQFSFPEVEPGRHTLVLCDMVSLNGVVYTGSDDGFAYALPWHLGQFEWAAHRLEAQGQASQAADFYAIAASLVAGDLPRKREISHKAAEMWCRANQPERSAYFLAGQLEDDRQVADQFRDAGKGLASLHPEKAAGLLCRAVEIYEELEDFSAARDCSRLAAKIYHAPYLSLRLVTQPAQWEAGKPQEICLQVKNHGNSAAQGIRLSLGGSLERRLILSLEPLAPGAEHEVYLPLIAAGQGNGSLQIEARLQDEQGRGWSFARGFEMSILPAPPGITIDGKVGTLDLYEQNLQQNIRIKGWVGQIKVRSEAQPAVALPAEPEPPPTAPIDPSQAGRKCPKCGQFRGKNDFCDECGIPLSTADEVPM